MQIMVLQNIWRFGGRVSICRVKNFLHWVKCKFFQ
jgi:hypothetical protein